GGAAGSFATFAATTAGATASGSATSTLGLALALGVDGTTESGSCFRVIDSLAIDGTRLIVLTRRLRISNKPMIKMSRAAAKATGIGFNWASRIQCSPRSFKRAQKSGRGCVEAVEEVGEEPAIAALAGDGEPNGSGVGDDLAGDVVTAAGVTPAPVEGTMAPVRLAEFKFDWTAK